MNPKLVINENVLDKAQVKGRMRMMIHSNSSKRRCFSPCYPIPTVINSAAPVLSTKGYQSRSSKQYLKWNSTSTSTSMLPGPKARACLELARQAVEAVEAYYDAKSSDDKSLIGDMPITDYVHRPIYRQGKGKEQWIVTQETLPIVSNFADSSALPNHEPQITWKITRMYVDCGGFIRNILCSVLHFDEFVYVRSDRDYMRAKDFYTWISSLPMLTNTDHESYDANPWRRVHDLRHVIPGDILVYRRAGNAVGGAAFTTADLYNLPTLVRAVRMAQLYKSSMKDHDEQTMMMKSTTTTTTTTTKKTKWNSIHVADTINFAKDSTINEWVKWLTHILEHDFGITNVTQLCQKVRKEDGLNTTLTTFWTDLEKKCLASKDISWDADTVDLLQEALSATEVNTGHVVMVAGPARLVKNTNFVGGNNNNNEDVLEEYRIPIFHSTETGRVHPGVERNYRRVVCIRHVVDGGQPIWMRPRRMKQDGTNKDSWIFLDVAVGRLCA
jgi:hypothetical protein